ncbi:MAG: glycosyltransferase [Clostridiales bacterium]|nr:glycosyltransferase [Clostridiales bacterium]
MERVLVCGFTENRGGMESYLMNVYRNIDREKLQFDFINLNPGEMAFTEEINLLGGHVYKIPRRRDDIAAHKKALDDLLSAHNYKGMYYQCTRRLTTMEFFKLAKKYGIEKRVIHSHSSDEKGIGTVSSIRKKCAALTMNRYINGRLACSKAAGKWMFGSKEYLVINNGIDHQKYRFNSEKRQTIRSEYGISNDTFVLGTVGRLAYEKNPLFMIELFNEYKKKHKKTVFLHVGTGVYLEQMKQRIKELSLEDSYLLLGERKDVYDLLNAFDVFLLPSLYEGFPLVLVESQANGLQCVISDNITRDIDLTGLVQYGSIQNISEWIGLLENARSHFVEREKYSEVVREKGFGIEDSARKIQEYFLS